LEQVAPDLKDVLCQGLNAVYPQDRGSHHYPLGRVEGGGGEHTDSAHQQHDVQSHGVEDGNQSGKTFLLDISK